MKRGKTGVELVNVYSKGSSSFPTDACAVFRQFSFIPIPVTDGKSPSYRTQGGAELKEELAS